MKKSKPKAAANKAAKKGSAKMQKPANPVEMRQSVTDMVGSEMKNITHAVVEEAKKGQLATVKYLFEVSGVYPAATEQNQARPEEGETLARMLLTRLGLPLEPAISPDDEVREKVSTPAAKRAEKDRDSAEDERKKQASGRSPSGVRSTKKRQCLCPDHRYEMTRRNPRYEIVDRLSRYSKKVAHGKMVPTAGLWLRWRYWDGQDCPFPTGREWILPG